MKEREDELEDEVEEIKEKEMEEKEEKENQAEKKGKPETLYEPYGRMKFLASFVSRYAWLRCVAGQDLFQRGSYGVHMCSNFTDYSPSVRKSHCLSA